MTSPARSQPPAHAHEEHATFTSFEASTEQDRQTIGGQFAAYAARLPDRILAHLSLREGNCGGFHHLGLDRNQREQFRRSAWFARTAEFCARHDGPAFDPKAETLPLHCFEPMVRRVLARPRKSLYVSDKGGMPVRAAGSAR